ncbi:MAG TPA: cytochrome c [Gammaproteobacteria bacterium]|nr:cytochrome c [Gammaproteobacteria bacterium]
MKALALGLAASIFATAASAADAPTLEHGAQVFEKWCLPCHGHGDQFPGTVALGVKYQGKLPGALQDRTDLVPDFVKAVVRTGVSVMPFFRKTEVSDSDLDALAAYLAEPKKK